MLTAQVEKLEMITIFGNRLKSPVEMQVTSDQDKIIFNVLNKSYYLYDFNIKFGDFQNLSPRIFEKRTTLLPGLNRLFTLTIVDVNAAPQMSYQISYKMIGTNNEANLSMPYLIPVGKGRTVNLVCIISNGDSIYLENHFKTNRGDTVFSARKGYVTALPDQKTEVDRIDKNAGLEIRHDDGTVAVYIGLDPDISFVKLGQTVYPGQPVGITGSSEQLHFNVYALQGDGRLKNLDLLYAGDNGQTISSKKILRTKVVYPENIIKKEMTKKELKKFENGSLYNK